MDINKLILTKFVNHLANNGYDCVKVDRWPDEENRQSPDIDAIAGRYAIEHTSIDTLYDQRKRGFYFEGVVKKIEAKYKDNLPFMVNISVPYDSTKKKFDWNKIGKSFQKWIEDQAKQIPEQFFEYENIEGIPFKFIAQKIEAGVNGVFFSRPVPEDNNLPERLKNLVLRKIDKLDPYKDQNMDTILLVESNDRALMNNGKFFQTVRESFSEGLPISLSELWFVHRIDIDNLYFYKYVCEEIE